MTLRTCRGLKCWRLSGTWKKLVPGFTFSWLDCRNGFAHRSNKSIRQELLTQNAATIVLWHAHLSWTIQSPHVFLSNISICMPYTSFSYSVLIHIHITASCWDVTHRNKLVFPNVLLNKTINTLSAYLSTTVNESRGVNCYLNCLFFYCGSCLLSVISYIVTHDVSEEHISERSSTAQVRGRSKLYWSK